MEFNTNNQSKATKQSKSSAITPASKAGTFKVNTEKFATSVIPEPMVPMIKEIGEGLGVDLTDLSSLTKDQVIQAKKLAAGLDEKLMMMKELAPAIMKYLSFQVSAAEFQAELVVQSLKAKSKIDQAQAKAFVAYYKYLRQAQRLEKRVNQQRQIIDAAYNAFESVQDARCNAILSGINQQARLGESSVEHAENLKQERQKILADRRGNLEKLKHELKTAHLAS